MLLIRDVLDTQMVDRDKHRIGKVDGLVLELREGSPPRVVYIEAGATTLARRLSRRLGRLAGRLARRWGGAHAQPCRLSWTLVREIGIEVTVDVSREETRLNAVEEWLRVHVVERIPGSGKRA